MASVARALFENGADILEAHQFEDVATSRFFSRIRFNFIAEANPQELRGVLASVSETFQIEWTLRDLATKSRVLLLVSRQDHCLAELLYRWRVGDLIADIAGIVSNYPRDMYPHHDFGEIPFDHLPVTAETKSQQEAQLFRIITDRRVDLVVLARYMQILSSELASKLAGRCINIHHSFLPAFKGAKPYHQAYGRGVKVIGATAHYVTEDLDEGPIIAQDVEAVTHYDTPEALASKGRDIERRVLSAAVQWHLEGRVLLNGRRTVVFKD